MNKLFGNNMARGVLALMMVMLIVLLMMMMMLMLMMAGRMVSWLSSVRELRHSVHTWSLPTLFHPFSKVLLIYDDGNDSNDEDNNDDDCNDDDNDDDNVGRL